MMHGRVSNALEPVVRITLIGPSGTEIVVNAIVDTGFSGTLIAPLKLITALRLSPYGQVNSRMADGVPHLLTTFLAEMDWDGSRQLVLIAETGKVVLLGMDLLLGLRLTIDIQPGGLVEINTQQP